MRFKDIHLYCRNESYVIHIIWLWVFMVLPVHIALVGGDGMIMNGGTIIRSCFDAITMFVCDHYRMKSMNHFELSLDVVCV